MKLISRKPQWGLPATAMAAALLVAGCGGGSNKNDSAAAEPPPVASTEQERFDARDAVRAAESARAAAERDVADNAVSEIAAVLNAVEGEVARANEAVDAARLAGTDDARASEAADSAASEVEMVNQAMQEVEAARLALDQATADYEQATRDADIETQAGATVIQTAANTLKDAAENASMAAATAMENANVALDEAMSFAQMAADAAEPVASTEQERFDARDARSLAEDARAEALQIVTDDAASRSERYADVASEAQERARAARTDARTASEQSERASEQAEIVRSARAALDEAIAEYERATQDADIETQQGARAITDAANNLRDAADTARTSVEAAIVSAETFAEEATAAAGTHVLELFRTANAYGEEAAEQDAFIEAAGEAIVGAANANNADTVSVTPIWNNVPVNGDTPADVDLKFQVDDIEVDSDNVRVIDPLGDFEHGREMEVENGFKLIVFTDKKQADAPREGVTAIEAKEFNTASVRLGKVQGDRSDPANVTFYDEEDLVGGASRDFPDAAYAYSGGLTCPDATVCSIETDGTVVGYVFTGKREAVAAVSARTGREQNDDYLSFGIWLKGDNVSNLAFGAFEDGGDPIGTTDGLTGITGNATYSGSAAGAHHKTGEGVNWFDGKASLTAKFGDASSRGTVEGDISEIRVGGGAALEDKIRLQTTPIGVSDTVAAGVAVMGSILDANSNVQHKFEGTWNATFYGPDTNDEEENIAPKAIGGTFGVSDTTDEITESFIGAFGAKKQ